MTLKIKAAYFSIFMQVSISSKTIPTPWDKPPGHDSKGEKPSLRNNHCFQNPPLGTNREA